jgi:hypothetical protein
MLDDASEQGLKEALRLLPVSSKGSGLLLTSHKLKPEATFSDMLASRDDGAAASVAMLECNHLSEAMAEKLFHACGFKLEPEDAAISFAVCQELKVQFFLSMLVISSFLFSGYGLSSCCCATICRVEQPSHDQGWCSV